MGQSASRPDASAVETSTSTSTRSSTNLEGKELSDLSHAELQALLWKRPWTKEEVLTVAANLLSSTGDNSDSGCGTGYYSLENESPNATLAARINASSETIAKLRFQVVPSKLKEPLFWECVFTLLEERMAEQAATNNAAKTTSRGASSSSYTSSFPDDEVEEEYAVPKNNDHVSLKRFLTLRDQLATKDRQIAALQGHIEEQEQRISLQEAAAAESNHGTRSSQAPPPPPPLSLSQHKGEWIVDADSKEFWQYPDEVKENMRTEKQKRLRQVHQDMKFILDSDAVEDSNGHWQCCGQDAYQSECTKS